jgi:hypothetical protein
MVCALAERPPFVGFSSDSLSKLYLRQALEFAVQHFRRLARFAHRQCVREAYPYPELVLGFSVSAISRLGVTAIDRICVFKVDDPYGVRFAETAVLMKIELYVVT